MTRRSRVALLALAAAATAFVGGFVAFGARIAAEKPHLPQKAEGMVVLTGGAERIADAIHLLAKGHARRLLITGVAPVASAIEIARNIAGSFRIIDCCVDLGYAAQNTEGNALEAEEWARANGLSHSLIIVTAAYHMPRAMAEMRYRLPNSSLFAYPVVPERLRGKQWWNDGMMFRLVASEYVKYISVRARILASGVKAS
jgi:uncharacterized SAM-binding protein YcdF (DUF218 family)